LTYVYCVSPLGYLIKNPPIPKTPVTVSLIKLKQCNAFLPTPRVCIRSYPKSILKQFLILDTKHPEADSSYRAVQGVWVCSCSLVGVVSGPHRRAACGLVSCKCSVLTGRGLTRPEDSYPVWCVLSVIVKHR